MILKASPQTQTFAKVAHPRNLLWRCSRSSATFPKTPTTYDSSCHVSFEIDEEHFSSTPTCETPAENAPITMLGRRLRDARLTSSFRFQRAVSAAFIVTT